MIIEIPINQSILDFCQGDLKQTHISDVVGDQRAMVLFNLPSFVRNQMNKKLIKQAPGRTHLPEPGM